MLGTPPPPNQLRRFPRYELQETHALARLHAIRHGPWYFSSRMSGRFDLPDPYGTCYLAASETAAFVEVFQRWIAQRIPIPRSEIDARHHSRLFVPQRFSLADCTHPRALEFGATGELHATPDRGLSQAWATAFHAVGFGGLRYFMSTTPAMDLIGVALFQASGVAPWPVASRGPISDGLLREIEQSFGVLVR